MNAKILPWSDLRRDFENAGGALFDVALDGAVEDYQRVIDVVRQRWTCRYTVDSAPHPFPADVREVFAAAVDEALLLEFEPALGIVLQTFFWGASESGAGLEFTFEPREITDQAGLDVVCDFLMTIGRAARKPVTLHWDGTPSAPIIRYHPATDSLERAPPCW